MLRCKVWRTNVLTICSPRKFHCIMTTLNKPFKIEFERGGQEKSSNFVRRRQIFEKKKTKKGV